MIDRERGLERERGGGTCEENLLEADNRKELSSLVDGTRQSGVQKVLPCRGVSLILREQCAFKSRIIEFLHISTYSLHYINILQ